MARAQPCLYISALYFDSQAVTDCPAYFIFTFLFCLLVPLLSVTPGRFAHRLHNLSMD